MIKRGWRATSLGTLVALLLSLVTVIVGPLSPVQAATWSASITYDGNGFTSGSVPSVQTVVPGNNSLSANTGDLRKTGHSFAGWNTQSNGLGTTYAEGGTFSVVGAVTLYAKWTSVITFDGNSGTTGLPPGMRFNTSTGALSGTPTSVAGATAYTVTANNASGSATRTFTLRVDAATCATGGTCIVGDTGPGGGIVYYVSATNFTSTGSTCDTACKYLEYAPTDAWVGVVNASFACADAVEDLNAQGSAIGTGYANTLAMVGRSCSADSRLTPNAADLARDYRGPNNLSDWYLPSRDELVQMCRWARGETIEYVSIYGAECSDPGDGSYLASVPRGLSSAYFSSSEDYGSGSVWVVSIADGRRFAIDWVSYYDFYTVYSPFVRPVRAFGSVFPPTTNTISVAAIAGVTAPVKGLTPVRTTIAGTGYTGTVAWSGSPATFAGATIYTATITLTPTSGYTLTGVTTNFFTVAGATMVTNSANAGVITAVFPATAYIVGDTGPGGGIVYHVATTPFDCGPTRAATCTYLEASPDVLTTTADWAYSDYSATAVYTSTGIGWGYSNTRAIILQGNVVTSAAALADAYTVTVSGVVYDDWFLPSLDELNQLHLQQATVGGFTSGSYWSSSEANESQASNQYFEPTQEIDGGVAESDKYHRGDFHNGYSVRAVRAFGSATSAPAFTLSSSSENRIVNTVATGFTINSTGGPIASFAISAIPGTSSPAVDSTLVLPLNTGTLVKSGYSFDGWNTQADGLGISYAAGGNFSLTGNVTLYAKWLSTITYDANGGTGDVPNPQNSVDGNVRLDANPSNLVKGDLIFDQWSRIADGSANNYGSGATFALSGSTTLYAIYAKRSYLRIITPPKISQNSSSVTCSRGTFAYMMKGITPVLAAPTIANVFLMVNGVAFSSSKPAVTGTSVSWLKTDLTALTSGNVLTCRVVANQGGVAPVASMSTDSPLAISLRATQTKEMNAIEATYQSEVNAAIAKQKAALATDPKLVLTFNATFKSEMAAAQTKKNAAIATSRAKRTSDVATAGIALIWR